MKRKIQFLVVCLLLAGINLYAQNPAVSKYIETYRELAIAEMQRTGVPASIKLAQGILETEAGNSDLVRRSNNHFGIKCKNTWTGSKVYHDDDARGECFRKYDNAEESYRDHSNFLKNSPRYASLFELNPEDYSGWAWGLKKAGYATNPKYSQTLIRYIEQYDLQQYSLIALGKSKREDGSSAIVSAPSVVHVEENRASRPPDPTPVKAETEIAPPARSRPVYPAGEFQINDTRVIYASAGTSLLKIATDNNIPYKYLLDFNEKKVNEDVLAKEELVFLQRKRRQGSNEFHTVISGETLRDIAQAEGIRLENLCSFNQLNTSMQPAEGEKLNLQDFAYARPKLAGAEVQTLNTNVKTVEQSRGAGSNLKKVLHVVQMKETLYAISKKYGVPVDAVKEWNQLESEALKIGQELLIYPNIP